MKDEMVRVAAEEFVGLKPKILFDFSEQFYQM